MDGGMATGMDHRMNSGMKITFFLNRDLPGGRQGFVGGFQVVEGLLLATI